MTTTVASITADQVAMRRSPLHEVVDHLHPVWKLVQGMFAPVHFGDAAGESLRAKTLGLCDASAFPRMGVKGKGAEAWLASQGVQIPAKVYGHHPLREGQGTIIRTGSTEYLIEDGGDSSIVTSLLSDQNVVPTGVYRYRRQDAVICLSGERAIDVFAETCGYNFREPDADLVFTRIAGVSCGIRTIDRYAFPVYQIWCDGSFGAYLWEQLYAISGEHGGTAVGLATFFPSLTA